MYYMLYIKKILYSIWTDEFANTFYRNVYESIHDSCRSLLEPSSPGVRKGVLRKGDARKGVRKRTS